MNLLMGGLLDGPVDLIHVKLWLLVLDRLDSQRIYAARAGTPRTGPDLAGSTR